MLLTLRRPKHLSHEGGGGEEGHCEVRSGCVTADFACVQWRSGERGGARGDFCFLEGRSLKVL